MLLTRVLFKGRLYIVVHQWSLELKQLNFIMQGLASSASVSSSVQWV